MGIGWISIRVIIIVGWWPLRAAETILARLDEDVPLANISIGILESLAGRSSLNGRFGSPTAIELI